MTPRVREILNWYGADTAGTLTNLSRLLSHGRLAGTGKLVILPVQDALRLGCCAVGFTIYPGSAHQLEMYGQLRTFAEEAKRLQRANIMHLVDLERGGYSPRRTEMRIQFRSYPKLWPAEPRKYIGDLRCR